MTTQKIVGAHFNIERDRTTKAYRTDLTRLRQAVIDATGEEPAFLSFNEASDAGSALQAFADLHLYRVIRSNVRPGQKDNVLLLRGDLGLGRTGVEQMTSEGWITVRGGKTPRKYLTQARIIILPGPVHTAFFLTVGVVHLPPSVNWRKRRPHFMTGPAKRILAYRAHQKSLRRWIRAQDGPYLVVGDWNATPRDLGRGAPRSLAHRVGARLAAPTAPTHGRQVIDYAITNLHNVRARVLRFDEHSDHQAVLFTIG